jgi:hypothetical protein
VNADHRSAHPNILGVPWWGAVLIAVTLTAVGFAYDAGTGDKELSMVFAACYVVGCVFAVLAVRQSAIFTAVIQPPLVLFVAVPTAYFLFHGGKLGGLKDVLINCGYPLIERFPLMFFTSVVALIVGMVRWFLGKPGRQATTASAAKSGPGESAVSAVTAKISALFTGESTDEDDVDMVENPRRRHTIDRPSRPSKTAAASATPGGKPTKRTSPSRSRHTRPPETEIIEAVVERPRRSRTPRRTEQPPVPSAEPRRRPRTASTREPRKATPPADRRSAYERSERRRRFDDYQPHEPHVANGNGTHHPISRVRYRGEAEERSDHGSRPRTTNAWQADSWEYDV